MAEGEIKAKKSHRLTKTVLLTGTGLLIGYSVIKSKLLGNPPSKIRKGLFYAGLAGLILYKCQGDKVHEFTTDARETISEVYQDYRDMRVAGKKKADYIEQQKRFIQEKEDELIKRNELLDLALDSLKIRNRDIENLEQKIYARDKKIDSTLNVLEERNKEKSYLLQKASNSDSIIDSKQKEIVQVRYFSAERETVLNLQKERTEKILKEKERVEEQLINLQKTVKTIYEKNPKENVPTTKSAEVIYEKSERDASKYVGEPLPKTEYVKGKELTLSSNRSGFSYYLADSYVHPDWLWILADGSSSLFELSTKFYGSSKYAEEIKEFNRIAEHLNDDLPEGMPVALKEKNLIFSRGVFKGGFPRALEVSGKKELEKIIQSYSSVQCSNIDAGSAIIEYNKAYGRSIEQLIEKAEREKKSCYLLLPRFLKFNPEYSILAGYSERWVGLNEQ